jgi:anti-sigma factor RsiW
MHAVLMDSLEEYLAGTAEPAELREIEAHLKSCATCREELAGMQQVSYWMRALKPEQPIQPAPGFYARVMQQIGDRKPAPTFSSLFALDLAFGRRVAFGCLLTLAVLGSYLVTRETGEPATLSPEVVMAQQDAPTLDGSQAHEAMLATLTRYEP